MRCGTDDNHQILVCLYLIIGKRPPPTECKSNATVGFNPLVSEESVMGMMDESHIIDVAYLDFPRPLTSSTADLTWLR